MSIKLHQQSTSKALISLAQALYQDNAGYDELTPEQTRDLARYEQMQADYFNNKLDSVELTEFAIPLSCLDSALYQLLELIGWWNFGKMANNSNNYLFTETSKFQQGRYLTEGFITIRGFATLLQKYSQLFDLIETTRN